MKQLRVSHETLIVQVPFISVYTHNCSAPSFNAFQLEIGGLQLVDKSVGRITIIKITVIRSHPQSLYYLQEVDLFILERTNKRLRQNERFQSQH